MNRLIKQSPTLVPLYQFLVIKYREPNMFSRHEFLKSDPVRLHGSRMLAIFDMMICEIDNVREFQRLIEQIVERHLQLSKTGMKGIYFMV